MKVSGFSFIKNALIYDYPIVEAIKSILPICDNFVVAVGQSDDETLNLIRQIDQDKIIIIETQWDENLREGGRVLALETDKAIAQIPDDSDWAFYIQGDEVVHEKYLDTIYNSMLKYKDEPAVDGLLFKYQHFYGSYDYVGASSNWYSHEIRVIRNRKTMRSFRDAQGFRKEENKILQVRPINAYIYHYGWVKDPRAMQLKQQNFNKYWHNDNWLEDNVRKAEEFDYGQHVRELKLFEGTHPEVMKNRIATKNWRFDYDISFNRKTFKDKVKEFMSKQFGIVWGYKNYRIAKLQKSD